MKTLTIIACFLVVAFGGIADETTAKPKLKVAADGFPNGHEIPEGAVCDLARSYITGDVALFTNACVRPFGVGLNRASYESFLEDAIRDLKTHPAGGFPRLKAITKLIAGRHLSKKALPAYIATAGFQDIVLVEIEVLPFNGPKMLNRAFVMRDKDGKWYVHPNPDGDSVLSLVLGEEPISNKDFSEAYDIQK